MQTWIEIDRKAIEHNIKGFKRLIGKEKMLMPVVKANAYGHGMVEVAKICDKSKDVDRICVVSGEEAAALRRASIKKPIQILSFYDLDESIKKIIGKNIIFPVYNLEQIHYLHKIGERLNIKIKINLKVDTGASRTGILFPELDHYLDIIVRSHALELEGLMSHFASSEEDSKYTKEQIDKFKQVLTVIGKRGIKLKVMHMACSAASALHKDALFNGTRLGLSLYGLYPAEKVRRVIKLKPALSWHTKVIQVKKLKPGTKIGYGGTYTTKTRETIAVLPIGYWDGFDRGLSNKGEVLVEGIRCPVRGRICMNLTMVDVSRVHNIKVGTKVTIIGKCKQKVISADNVAKKLNTINYEVVARINPLIPRIYV